MARARPEFVDAALGFAQPNRTLIERAYADLVGGEAGALAFDLYAGAGAITALLRENFARVVPCERYPESAAALGVAPMDVAEFLDTTRERPDVIVANPPRKGFGADVCAMGEGGTIPFMGMLGAKFPEAQFVITGVLGPQSNAHGPNEFLHVPTAKKLTSCVAQILEDHAARKP